MDKTMENEERDIITLTDEDGTEVQCEFLDTVEMDGKLYCVVEPLTGSAEYEEGSCYIFHITENGDETVDLTPIEDEKELNAVFEKFLENNAEECSGDCSSCSGCEEK
ncbi:MAG TPA: DUF1292 domain-containing protein [Clostridiales bacterium]|nr:DUF1292 domain-containing protein [Clostridiales bacterium]HCU56073.1 DUF1292 domain-containing protein [Clostridiales bacterium]